MKGCNWQDGSVRFQARIAEHPIPVLGPCEIGPVLPDAIERPAGFNLSREVCLNPILPIFRQSRYFQRRLRFLFLFPDVSLMSVILLTQSAFVERICKKPMSCQPGRPIGFRPTNPSSLPCSSPGS